MERVFFGDIEVDAALLLAYGRDAERRTGVAVAPAHLVAKSVGRALRLLRRPAADVLVVSGDGGHGVAVAGDTPVLDIARRVGDGRGGTSGPVVGADIVAGDEALPHGYAPLHLYSAAPLVVRVGPVRERPVAVAGRVVCRPMLALTLTADAPAFAYGELARLATSIRDYLTNPQAYEPPFGVGTADVRNPVITSAV